MCQQWLSVIGLIADIVGFLVVAYEWHRTFKLDVHRRQSALQHAYDTFEAKQSGKEPPESEDELMAKEFSKLAHQESVYREWLFYVGATLIVIGFLLQALGSWPYADPIFGLKACS